MSDHGLWVIDPQTNEEFFASYADLDADIVQAFIKPVGGFIFPADLFVMKRLPSVPFYVKDWLPKRGKSYLYAPAKAGKSYLCLQLARCVGSGLPFLGISTTQGTVLYVQFELGEEILQYRMKDETKQSYPNVFVGTTFSMKLDTKHGQEQLWRAMEAVEPNVLILDPKIKMIAGDENESHEMYQVCDYLDSLIEGFNCSILVTDHAGKDIAKRGRGSNVWEGWADSYLKMKRTSKRGEQLKVRIEPEFLRHASLPPEPIDAIFGEDFEFHLAEHTATIKEQIEEFMSKSKETVSPAILFAQKFGGNTAVYSALSELCSEGKVKKEGRGLYCWVET